MNPASHTGLRPGLPEILLAAGALGLVLFGAYRGERSAGAITWRSGLLAVALVAV